jgi:hypothetical protein
VLEEFRQLITQAELEEGQRRFRVESFDCTRLFAPSIAQILGSVIAGSTIQRSAVAVLAIERHRRARGNVPDHLSQLVPDYLPAEPIDPVDGYPLRYIKRAHGYYVYGVGLDLQDNAGDLERADVGLFVPERLLGSE